jgi:hypothetical protein
MMFFTWFCYYVFVDVDSVADVSVVHAASIIRVEVNCLSQCSISRRD